MNLVKTSCCAIQDIDHLSVHTTPKEAMISFCQQAILKPPMFGRDIGVRDQISSFYLFTTAVGTAYRPYGQAFYDFTVKNNLGEVWQSPLRPNKAWHPDHENRVYVWMPNHANIKAWWVVNDPDKTEVVAAVKTRKRKAEPGPMPVPFTEDDLFVPHTEADECPF